MMYCNRDYGILLNSGGTSSSTYTSGNSKFTEHAADHILKRASSFVDYHMYDTYRPLLNDVNRNGYDTIERIVKGTFPICNINKIRQVYAPQMYGMYMLRKEEMKLTSGQSVQEKVLFHVTTESRAVESLDSGLDWRRTRRSKFGCGVSFSDDIDYANYYADNSSIEVTRVIMICCVLVGETYVVPKQRFARNQAFAGSSLVVPPGLADTTVSHNGRVHVKYNDNEFYPLYFVYYQRRPEQLTSSKYLCANHRRAQTLDQLQPLVNSLGAMRIYDY
ncbi:uncharacterized protein LOC132952164 [Metopolophium dirhodum]|uniref:uncharacterized protein LOC132952164 n=1 Tax=Metopolophium dirhodum TaxID=44670 RepID=UPI00298F77D7|nr:uncharacterized protein LOC132952164 [Metopolophium dirhodum]